jgi:hypothetical protein
MSKILCTVAAALALTACATAVQPGMTRADVQAKWGQPTRVVPLPTGERLQYSYQPWGQQAVMVDLDAAGRVTQVRQVLDEAEFARISTKGDWTRADVEREFGPPAYVGSVASWDGPILTYRWRGGMIDQLYWVYLDRAGVVRRAHAGMDPRQFRDDR